MEGVTLKQITEVGMGVCSFAMLLWIIVKVMPAITALDSKLSATLAQNQEVIRNNTDALMQQAKANENVANALAIIGSSTSTVCTSLEKHDQRAETMMMDIIKLRGEVSHLTQIGRITA